MKMEIKKFENYTTVNFSELGNNMSAKFHTNMKNGEQPYIKKGGKFELVDINKSIPKSAEYFIPSKVEEYNKIADLIIELQQKQIEILK